MTLHHDTFSTPIGRFSVAVDDTGAVVSTAVGGASALDLGPGAVSRRNAGRTAAARIQLQEYFAGRRTAFDLPLAERGTRFQRAVWAVIRSIPFGRTMTYAQVAARAGAPRAARAVGGASGANPVCVIVPCHRVIGSDGSLTGFAFGEGAKRKLLALESGR
jgi:methylated-DNA-[protein]-cysteine S-methyltransferase